MEQRCRDGPHDQHDQQPHAQAMQAQPVLFLQGRRNALGHAQRRPAGLALAQRGAVLGGLGQGSGAGSGIGSSVAVRVLRLASVVMACKIRCGGCIRRLLPPRASVNRQAQAQGAGAYTHCGGRQFSDYLSRSSISAITIWRMARATRRCGGLLWMCGASSRNNSAAALSIWPRVSSRMRPAMPAAKPSATPASATLGASPVGIVLRWARETPAVSLTNRSDPRCRKEPWCHRRVCRAGRNGAPVQCPGG